MNTLTRRRSILERASLSLLSSSSSLAIILIGDSTPPALAVEDAQFVEVGQQERPPNGETPFTTLSDGVQIKDFRVAGGGGGGSGVVRAGSRVELTMKGRLLNLNGVIFYDTKENDPNGFGEGSPLVFTVGSNTVLPGLESGIIGMTKGGIRRIIIPANVGYGAYPTLEPQPLSEMGKRALESVTKNPRRDQTVLFDVRVDRVSVQVVEYSVSNANTKIQFCLAGTTATDKASWYSLANNGSAEERSMKTALKKGSKETLNVYVISPIEILGWTYYYPSEVIG
ncbi:hypothetical protein ACHAWU_000955 [Discostella pseudostelligera]|uniref:peptidylprolyl isomerase n=1 Tax=Discostella pseudostelligera TaxID=259834 RepID=A0ABD3MHF1_9STRA